MSYMAAATESTTISVRLSEADLDRLDHVVEYMRERVADEHPELAAHCNRSAALRHALNMYWAEVKARQEEQS